MIPFSDILYAISTIITAILLLWFVSLEILKSKKIMKFLPFFGLSIRLCFSAALSFYGIHDQKIWFTVELFLGIWLLWALTILIKNKNV